MAAASSRIDSPGAPPGSDAALAAWRGLDFDPEQSARVARQLLADADARSDRRLQAAALCVLAWHGGMRAHDLALALEQAHGAMQRVDELPAPELRPRAHAAMAMVLGALGDRAGRFEQLEAMRRSAADQGDGYHEMLALHDLGLVYDRPELLEQALEVAERLPQPGVGVISNLVHSAMAKLRRGDVDTARARAARARVLAFDVHTPRWQVEALRILAHAQACGNDQRAALNTLAALQAHAGASPALVDLCAGRVHAALASTGRAIDAYRRCLSAAGAPPRLLHDAARELAPLLARARRWRQAYECQLQAEGLRGRLEREDNERRLRGLELQHRLALREQQIEQERARQRELAEHVQRLEALNREVTELSVRDALTGQYNRRQADAELQRALARVDRGHDTLALALLDIDHFKRVNDRHGHAVGDRVLQALAQVVAAQLRACDLLARFGGEEFLLLLAGVQAADAASACERIRQAVAAHDWGALASGLHVTVSVGLAQATAGQSADALLGEADARLYRAKRAGRNRVVGAGDG